MALIRDEEGSTWGTGNKLGKIKSGINNDIYFHASFFAIFFVAPLGPSSMAPLFKTHLSWRPKAKKKMKRKKNGTLFHRNKINHNFPLCELCLTPSLTRWARWFKIFFLPLTHSTGKHLIFLVFTTTSSKRFNFSLRSLLWLMGGDFSWFFLGFFSLTPRARRTSSRPPGLVHLLPFC